MQKKAAAMLPESFLSCLALLEGCFTSPSYQRFVTLMTGWVRTWLPFRQAPWYRKKKAPSFADMLATLRRQSWTLWVSDHPALERLDQKDLEPLLDAVGYG